MSLRSISKVIDVRIVRWWTRANIVQRALVIVGMTIGCACVFAGIYVAVFVAMLHYLIRSGNFIE